MATSSVNFVAALGTGSGVDIKALAQNLVDAEKAPRKELIQKRIDKNQARSTAYRTVGLGIDELAKAMEALKSPTAFNVLKAQSSQPQAVTATVTDETKAAPGSFAVSVSRLAQAQRTVSSEFPAKDTSLATAGSTTRQLFIQVGQGQEKAVTVTTPTPEGLMAAVNSANLGVTASLVNTAGTPPGWRLVLTGAQGAANAFTVRAVGLDLGQAATPGTGPLDQKAQDATFKFNGLEMTRASNSITDVVDGVTLNLKSALSEANTASVSLDRDTSSVKDKIKSILTAYNDLQAIFDAGFDPNSKVEGLGGALVGDITARRVRDQIRRMMLPDTPPAVDGTSLTGLRSLGFIIDGDKQMKLATLVDGNPNTDTLLRVNDDSTLDQMLSSRFADVTKLFSSFNGLGKELSDQLRGDGLYVDSVDSPSSPKKLFLAGTSNAAERIKDDQKRLSELEDRMKGLLERYMKQFSVMDSLVGESKSIRTGVENSFKGMNYSRA